MTALKVSTVVICVCFGCGLVWFVAMGDRGKPPSATTLGNEVANYELALNGIALGLSVAGVVLGGFKLICRKRFDLSGLEILWMAPMLWWLSCIFVSKLTVMFLPVVALVVFLAFLCGILAFGFAGLMVLCQSQLNWESRMACISCVVIALAVIANVVLHPIRI